MSEYAMSKASNEMTEHAEQQQPTYTPSEHGGKRKDGQPDKRMSSEHGFGGDKELASEAGRRGGSKTGEEIAHDGEAVGPDPNGEKSGPPVY
ncbi:hypothetical protein JCM8097_003202 [Rhodosporidiobolus ruineniae]